MIEGFEIFSIGRKAPKGPVSGAESALGRPAIVIGDFSSDLQNTVTGRVRFDGEDWNAIYVGDAARLPRSGDTVSIHQIDASRLKVIVK